MRYAWTDLQFVAGTAALDFANTVCFRHDPARRFDKISDATDLIAFARAARLFSDTGRFATDDLASGQASLALTLCREAREATDALFRPVGRGARPDAAALSTILRLTSALLPGHSLDPGESGIALARRPQPGLALVLLDSALRLAYSADLSRLKICPNCGWLFIDRSRNGSRVWCDMLTCGNRAKAQRHQRRSRSTGARITAKRRVGG